MSSHDERAARKRTIRMEIDGRVAACRAFSLALIKSEKPVDVEALIG